MQPEEHNEQLGNAIENLFSDEPVATGTILSTAATGTLTYLSFYGFVDNETVGAITGVLTLWLPVFGLIVRSQFTPFAHRE